MKPVRRDPNRRINASDLIWELAQVCRGLATHKRAGPGTSSTSAYYGWQPNAEEHARNMPGMPLMENPGMGPKYAGPGTMSMGTSPMQQMPQQMMPFMGGRG